MAVRTFACAAAAALACIAAPASAAGFIGDAVTIKRIQNGSVFRAVDAVVGTGFEYTDNFFRIDITGNEVIFTPAGGTFSIGEILFEISGLDFDDDARTANIIEGFNATQIFNRNLTLVGQDRASFTPEGAFRYSFAQTTGGANGLVRLTFGAAPLSGAVPEPATWAMMIGGSGLAGGALRVARRRKDRLAYSL